MADLHAPPHTPRHPPPLADQPSFRLRHLRMDDLERLAAITADPAVMHHVGDGSPLTLEQAGRWIDRSQENYRRLGYGTFAVADPETDALIGWAGFVPPGAEAAPELIYGLGRDSWGRGLGRAVAASLIALARDRFGFETILATVDADHLPSIRILEGLGFRLDGMVEEETVTGWGWCGDTHCRLPGGDRAYDRAPTRRSD
ncbi:MAG: hypothetical protein RLY86_2186 [Pseudomonadota bacterium]